VRFLTRQRLSLLFCVSELESGPSLVQLVVLDDLIAGRSDAFRGALQVEVPDVYDFSKLLNIMFTRAALSSTSGPSLSA
jgi:hypothetical protein